MKILLVEDEKKLLQDIKKGLNLAGYSVDTAEDGESAEEMIYVENYDLVILDINLPKMDGFEVLETVREYNKEIPIIMLTARSDIEDRVQGLDLGANDYLLKPFHFAELEARIRSLLRRKTIISDSKVKCKNIVFDTSSRRTFFQGEEIKLTKKETGILEYLFLNSNRYIKQEEILEHVWEGDAEIMSNTARVHISSLRKKLKTISGSDIIKNVIGKGYKIDEEEHK